MSTIDINVDVHHLARVEGHGNIVVRIRGGKVEEAKWEVVETPRFFEIMLKGKHYTSAGILTARICGICSIGHCLASIRATERAFGVEVPPMAAKLRLLAKHAETLQSHALHLFFLAAPDFLGLPSAVPLLETRSCARVFRSAAQRSKMAKKASRVSTSMAATRETASSRSTTTSRGVVSPTGSRCFGRSAARPPRRVAQPAARTSARMRIG